MLWLQCRLAEACRLHSVIPHAACRDVRKGCRGTEQVMVHNTAFDVASLTWKCLLHKSY